MVVKFIVADGHWLSQAAGCYFELAPVSVCLGIFL